MINYIDDLIPTRPWSTLAMYDALHQSYIWTVTLSLSKWNGHTTVEMLHIEMYAYGTRNAAIPIVILASRQCAHQIIVGI